MIAIAYVYHGEWGADCPRPDCYNSEFLHNPADPTRPSGPGNPRVNPKPVFSCSNCGELAPIAWPPYEMAAEIVHVLSQRPVPGTRNWYPQDHPVAVRSRIPHGQSPDDLRRENHDHGVAVG